MKDRSFVVRYADMDIDELEFELEDLNRAIEDAKSWLLGDVPEPLKQLTLANITDLHVEAAYVRKLIKELMYE